VSEATRDDRVVLRRAPSSRDALALMAAEVREGLSARPLPFLPSKYFYDDRGSALFDEITRLPEYYPTRTEEGILEAVADQVARVTRPREVVELGSGTGRKIRRLLAATARATVRCVLFDVNETFLTDSCRRLARDFPGLEVNGIVGDFTHDLDCLGPGGGRLVVFFAGTIGNLHPDEAVPAFLVRLARQLAPGDAFLVGVDLVKDEARLHAAYNDAAGVTARFNLNILRVVNDRLGADFDLTAFEHVAFYDRARAWIEMRVRARRATRVRIPRADVDLALGEGDEIRTEISAKYTRGTLEARLPGSGLRLEQWLTDADELFALALLRRIA
jgi:L-histidine N-alpha-methyltransferase